MTGARTTQWPSRHPPRCPSLAHRSYRSCPKAGAPHLVTNGRSVCSAASRAGGHAEAERHRPRRWRRPRARGVCREGHWGRLARAPGRGGARRAPRSRRARCRSRRALGRHCVPRPVAQSHQAMAERAGALPRRAPPSPWAPADRLAPGYQSWASRRPLGVRACPRRRSAPQRPGGRGRGLRARPVPAQTAAGGSSEGEARPRLPPRPSSAGGADAPRPAPPTRGCPRRARRARPPAA
mmetsp:Transcript_14855/g.45374  ORF Transcript_14855/g.45374 Transcript_14855/m.45374 type:complete len:238 (-) Transcript_14855:2479-3192(-)